MLPETTGIAVLEVAFAAHPKLTVHCDVQLVDYASQLIIQKRNRYLMSYRFCGRLHLFFLRYDFGLLLLVWGNSTRSGQFNAVIT